MNSGFRPIPPEMPINRAADLMVRRGESRTFEQARAQLRKRRSGYGRTEITAEDRAQRARVESPKNYRFPYKED